MLNWLTGGKSAAYRNASVQETSEAVAAGDVQLVDVRTREEYAGGHAADAVNVPLGELDRNMDQFDRDRPVYVICQSGMRSQRGAGIFVEAGFTEVYNVAGGTGAWISAGLPTGK